jgi:hypothetical protein
VRDPILDAAAAAGELADLAVAASETRDRRDSAIKAAFASGHAIASIAAATRLTPARVSMILQYPRGRPGRPRRSP